MAHVKEERLQKDLAKVEIHHYHDTEKKINILSREIFKTLDKEIHYPFVAYRGTPKYKNIKRFIFNDFSKKLPIGVFKSPNKGWGFTRELNPFGKFLDDLKIEEVIISKTGSPDYDKAKNTFSLTEADLVNLQATFNGVQKKNGAEVKQTVESLLHGMIPKHFAKPTKKFIPNSVASALDGWGNSVSEFGTSDKSAIKDLFTKLSLTNFLGDTLTKTKEIIDSKYLQATLDEFKKLMLARDTTLEKKWQKFLKQHNWIFSRIFAQPVILYRDEVYVGGKNMDNTNGKFNDFLMKSPLSSNVSFLEIKTHLTPMVEKKAYRGDDVYSSTKDLTGAIVQVLNQRSNFQKEYYALLTKEQQAASAATGKAKKGAAKATTIDPARVHFETHNSKCVVLIGSIRDLDHAQKESFELFRNNSRDVEIITFDELQSKIEALQDLLAK